MNRLATPPCNEPQCPPCAALQLSALRPLLPLPGGGLRLDGASRSLQLTRTRRNSKAALRGGLPPITSSPPCAALPHQPPQETSALRLLLHLPAGGLRWQRVDLSRWARGKCMEVWRSCAPPIALRSLCSALPPGALRRTKALNLPWQGVKHGLRGGRRSLYRWFGTQLTEVTHIFSRLVARRPCPPQPPSTPAPPLHCQVQRGGGT